MFVEANFDGCKAIFNPRHIFAVAETEKRFVSSSLSLPATVLILMPLKAHLRCPVHFFFFFFFFSLNLTYSRWTSSLPSCLWSQRIFPSLPGSRLRPFLTRKLFQEILGLEGSKISWEKTPFLTRKFPEKFPRPKLPQESLARILPAEEILKPKISWRQEEILRGNFGIT